MGIINYRIIVNTKDKYLAGTDNLIFMRMKGEYGLTDSFEMQGDQERRGQDAFTFTTEDVGIINRVGINVSGDLADKWFPYSIRILRKTNQDDTASADGYTEFVIDKELGYDTEWFSATTTVNPLVTVTPDGEIKEHSERVTMVQFDHNPHPTADQMVMKYIETWSSVDTVSISTEEQTTIGAHATITYESPETVAGTFGAEIGASWERAVGDIRTHETEKVNQREFNWEYLAPANSAVFRLQVFTIPYADQVYKTSDGSHSRIVRKLHAEIIPTGSGDFLYVPRRDDTGNVDPIPWRELENNWLVHMKPDDRKWFEDRHLNDWLAKGWVVSDHNIRLVLPTTIAPAGGQITFDGLQKVHTMVATAPGGEQLPVTLNFEDTQGKAHLNASAFLTEAGGRQVEVNGTFSYFWNNKPLASTDQLPAGQHTITVRFKPDDATNFKEVTTTVPIRVWLGTHVFGEYKNGNEETFSHLALKYYGHATPYYWQWIIDANKGNIPENYKHTQPGTKVFIPEPPPLQDFPDNE